jgi:hypothetical protein
MRRRSLINPKFPNEAISKARGAGRERPFSMRAAPVPGTRLRCCQRLRSIIIPKIDLPQCWPTKLTVRDAGGGN